MRTTLNLDNEALTNAMRYAHGKTKTDVINQALREFAVRKRQKELLDLRGKVVWEGDLDQLRKRV